ncbi:hypothetical protein CLOM_g20214 [Closterium sp. NIES-68]|nr:hypothetical protein CLOM_g20214 [Closterium sp. NIES-68]
MDRAMDGTNGSMGGTDGSMGGTDGSMELLIEERSDLSRSSLWHALSTSFGTITAISLVLTLIAALALTLPPLLSSLLASTTSPLSSPSSPLSSSSSPSMDDRHLMPSSAFVTLLRVLALVCVTPLLAFFTSLVLPIAAATGKGFFSCLCASLHLLLSHASPLVPLSLSSSLLSTALVTSHVAALASLGVSLLG